MARSAAPQKPDESDEDYARRLRQNEYHRRYVAKHADEIAEYQFAYYLEYRANPENQARQREASRRFRLKRAKQSEENQQT